MVPNAEYYRKVLAVLMKSRRSLNFTEHKLVKFLKLSFCVSECQRAYEEELSGENKAVTEGTVSLMEPKRIKWNFFELYHFYEEAYLEANAFLSSLGFFALPWTPEIHSLKDRRMKEKISLVLHISIRLREGMPYEEDDPVLPREIWPLVFRFIT